MDGPNNAALRDKLEKGLLFLCQDEIKDTRSNKALCLWEFPRAKLKRPSEGKPKYKAIQIFFGWTGS